jgi:radical SAM superfamily enzyme with C-terminal helix-hairpin-helix motif
LTQDQKRLTEDEVTEVIAEYRAGATILELATQHGCDRKTVIRYLKLHCVEVRHRRMSSAQIDEAVVLYKSGLSLIRVGKAVGADPKTVKARLMEAGVPMRGVHRRTECKDESDP